jgi:hypothetical protein
VLTPSVECDFRNEQLPSAVGKTMGPVKPVREGLQLGDRAASSGKPYVIMRREFDPAQGAVTVVCDMRFLGPSDASDTSFAMLTRSAEERGQAGTPGEDMLAQFLRCSFRVDPDSGEGLLETGTKYEADRELWNLSWGGFSRPQPGTRYRLEMRDDGLNVEFTVSLLDNPSVRKMIQCRSLFRGNHNFIALEGTETEQVLIERLQILHEGRPEQEFNQLAASGSQRAAQAGDEASHAPKFAELIPTGATLVLEEDFEDVKLDPQLWTVLGDAVLVDGQLQLGLANESDHIDTWKQRPYLLTQREFDPNDGAITIIGKVTFAENFLNGYGGSFAVMTRADDSHGNGPGWEYSILQRGVRSNFWPAALGFDHSLEIYEKPQPNTISLLKAEGFQINPRSRSYDFRVLDDGKTAALTFVDAENPEIRKTISHSIGAAMPGAGRIGFESCWGSPVLLDNVKIYKGGGQVQEQGSGGE